MKHVLQQIGGVDEFGAMESCDVVGAGIKTEVGEDGGARGGEREDVSERVVHDVADDVDAAGDALGGEIGGGLGGGAVETGGKVVGDDAIDLLGHAAVAAAQAGLHMGDGDVEFCGGEGARDGGVGVAVDEQPVGADGQELLLDAGEHLRGLRAVRAGADAEVGVGGAQAELGEEVVRHGRVVVLAGVEQELRGPGGGERGGAGAGFDELGAGAGRAPTTVRTFISGRRRRGPLRSAGPSGRN